MELEKLKEIGLTTGEIKVYGALLEIGLSAKGKISKKAGVSESKIYEILNRLSKKGLVSFVEKRKGGRIVMHYKANDPVMLKEFLNAKRHEIDNEEKIVEKFLPLLKMKMKAVEKEYSAVIYEGFNGIKTANKELLENAIKGDEWLAMGIRSDKPKEYNLYWINFLRQRAAKGIKARAIFVDKNTWYFNEFIKLKLTKVAYLPSISPAAIIVFGSNVMLYNYEEYPSCLKIVNNGIAESFKSLFESMWKIAEIQK